MKKLVNYRALAGLGLAVALAASASAPALAHNTAAEAANKQVVLDFYAALNSADATGSTKDQIKGIAEKYLSPDYRQNTISIPGPGTDRDKLVAMFQNMPARPAGGPAMPAQRTDAVMAEGDKVMLLTSRLQPDPATGEVKPSYIFNMFRVKDGKLVEHWDISPSRGGPGGPGGPGGAPGGPPPGAQ